MKMLLKTASFVLATVVSVQAAAAASAWTSQQTALNARSGPGTSYHVIAKFSPCTKVHVIKWSHGWAKVSWSGKHYWVSGKYLRNKPCEAHYDNHHKKYHTHYHKHGYDGHSHRHQMHSGHH